MRARRFAVAATATIIACAAALGFAARAASPTAAMTTQAPPPVATQCIAPPDQIRRTHPDLLKHQRDLTVRQGIRGEPASLKACIGCHAAPEYREVTRALTERLQHAGAVIDPSRFSDDQGAAFCQTCHAYAAVKLDCFECHARTGGSGMQSPQAFFSGLKR